MCGIAGFVDPQRTLASAGVLRVLGNSLAHRGPDGEGFFTEDAVGFAHRRLAIIDLTATGEQPVIAGPVVLVFNGEIYNYRELRTQLQELGQTFSGASDSEVLARAYLQWGPDCVRRLRGMWAFALYDRRTRSVLCSRDPFGIKPFYYALHRGAFLFASEPRALLAVGVPARANLENVAAFLALGVCDHTSETFFAGIQQLGAGRTVQVSRAGRIEPLSHVEPDSPTEGAHFAAGDFAQCLTGSIDMHLRSDVPIGTCLSGGLDSSTVAALASRAVREAGGGPFAAITAASGEEKTDERKFAAAVVEHCGLAWHVVQPDGKRFGVEIDDCIRAQGEPALSPSVYLQYRVMKQARAAGIKVMLDGQGGDELLCGYERYVPAFALDELRRRGPLTATREYLQLARNSRLGVRGMTALAAYLLLPWLRARFIASRSRFLRSELLDSTLALLAQMRPVYRDVGAARMADVTRFSLPALLRFEDRNSMAHSIEARVPYVDREVAAFSLRLPEAALLHDGFTKYPLRQLAARVLPDSIAWRRAKIGFEAPTGQWLQSMGERLQNEVAASTLVRRVCRGVPNVSEVPVALRWRLYNLARWQHAFDVEPG